VYRSVNLMKMQSESGKYDGNSAQLQHDRRSEKRVMDTLAG
jgi:hypothetical protein